MSNVLLPRGLLVLSFFLTAISLVAVHQNYQIGIVGIVCLYVGILGIGIWRSNMLRVTLVSLIPVTARILSLVIAPEGKPIQSIIFSGCVFGLGFWHAYPLLVFPDHLPRKKSVYLIVTVYLVAIAFGVSMAQLVPARASFYPFATMVTLVLFDAVAHEFAFRAAVAGELMRIVHPWTIMAAIAALEASMFPTVSWVHYIGIFIASLVATSLYLRRKNLWYPLFFMSLWKLVYFLITYIPPTYVSPV